MLVLPDPARVPPPAIEAAPTRGSLPIAAALAPLALAGVVWAVTGSPLGLLFAVLGPVVAVAGALDAARLRRSARRRLGERWRIALDRLEQRIRVAGDTERGRLARLASDPRDDPSETAAVAWAREGRPPRVLLGAADLPGPMRVEDDADAVAERPAVAAARLAELSTAALLLEGAPLVAEDPGMIGVVGPPIAARGVARAILVSALAAIEPTGTTVSAPADEGWLERGPHRVRRAGGEQQQPGGPEAFVLRRDGEPQLRVVTARSRDLLPVGCRVVLELADPDGRAGADAASPPTAEVVADTLLLDGAPDGRIAAVRCRPLSRPEARRAVERLAEVGRRLGFDAGGDPPPRVPWSSLAGAAGDPDPTSLAAPIGADGEGPVVVDLVADGPHAVVAGTTGSGKSELLVGWVLALAARSGPDELGFLLADFKGGASFDPLASLPHVRGIVTDLGPSTARRAMVSLRAELRRREERLRAAGAASIETLPRGTLPRLVVVIDEVAVLLEGDPALHDVLVDVAARGRSLGVHLVLCTQRPTGVLRDAALANIALRLCLRVADAAESSAVLGTASAARLGDAPPGRAILRDAAGERALQVARADPDDIDRVVARWAGVAARPEERPWLEPLPRDLRRGDLAVAAIGAEGRPLEPTSGTVFGLVDLPDRRRRGWAAIDRARDGHLLVVGGPASGRSTALATLLDAGGAGGAVALPDDVPGAYQVLARLGAEDALPDLLVIDDLDILLARADVDDRDAVHVELERVLRDARTRGALVAASAARLGALPTRLVSAFGSRLLLRVPDADDHVLAGGRRDEHDPGLPPGAGWWCGEVAQVARSDRPAAEILAAHRPGAGPLAIRPARGSTLAVVSARPREFAAAAERCGWRVMRPDPDTGASLDLSARGGADEAGGAGEVTVVLGDPDDWQSAWSALSSLRRTGDVVVHRGTGADLRALLRVRATPPPLDPGRGEVWLVRDGEVLRAALPIGARGG